MTDIARLGLQVDSSSVALARANLIGFRGAAARADSGSRLFVRGVGGATRTAAMFAATVAGTSAAIAGPAGLAIAMGKVASDSARFQKGMNEVLAVSGATEQQFDSLRAKALALGSATKFSATEVSDAMGFMARAGLRTETILGGVDATLNLAAAANIELGRSADIVTNIMTGYGQTVDQLGGSVDVLTKAFTSSNTTLDQLGEAFKFVGPLAAGIGADFEETAAALGLLGNAGLQGSIAGTGLREVFARLKDQTPETKRVIDALGLSITDSQGRLKPLVNIIEQLEASGADAGTAMQLFGRRGGTAMIALARQGSGALRELTEDLENSGGAAERIAEIQLRGLSGAMTEMKSAAEGLAIAIDDRTGLTRFLEELSRAAAGAFRSMTAENRKALPAQQKTYEELVVAGTELENKLADLVNKQHKLNEAMRNGPPQEAVPTYHVLRNMVALRPELEAELKTIRDIQTAMALASEFTGERGVPRPENKKFTTAVTPPVTDSETLSRIRDSKDFIKQLEHEQAQLTRTAREQEIYNNLQAAGVTRTSDYGTQIEMLTGNIYDYQLQQEAASAAAEYFGDVAFDSLSSIILHGEEASDVMKRLGIALAEAAAQAVLLGKGPLAGGGLLGGGSSAGPDLGGMLDFGGGGIAKSLIGGALSFIPGGGFLAGLFHQGGEVGPNPAAMRMVHASSFVNAPRFHGGGDIRSNEKAVIVEDGERIQSKDQVSRERMRQPQRIDIHLPRMSRRREAEFLIELLNEHLPDGFELNARVAG